MISRYIFSKYKPKIPNENKIKLPISKIMHVSEGHPATGSPNVAALITTNNNATIDKNDIIKPTKTRIVSGHVVKAIIASSEYLNKEKYHFNLPVSLGGFRILTILL